MSASWKRILPFLFAGGLFVVVVLVWWGVQLIYEAGHERLSVPIMNIYLGIDKIEQHIVQDHSPINIVTCCQGAACLENFSNLRYSANKHGFNIFRIEIKGKFSWPKLALAYSDFTDMNLSRDSLVVYLDASDIVVQGCPRELLQRFHALAIKRERSILAGVESHCTNVRKCYKMKHQHPPSDSLRPKELKYLNGGFIMGKAKECSRAWRDIGLRFQDTQLGWGAYADEHPNMVALDWDQAVVASNTAREFSEYFNFEEERHQVVHKRPTKMGIESKETVMSRPVFLHVLCHACLHPKSDVGKGGPQMYAKVVHVVNSVQNSTCVK